jgi:hypothetical protein
MVLLSKCIEQFFIVYENEMKLPQTIITIAITTQE